jgi:hypothetical protein
MDPRRERLRLELEQARVAFHAALDVLPPGAWRAPSRNPGWTNAELCFHMLLGFVLVPLLLRLMRWMARLPAWCDTGFARLLNAGTPLFNRVNALGPRVGARLLSRAAIARQFDRVLARILGQLRELSERDLGRGMHYPTRWDPRFRAVMTAEDLLRYPAAHLEHHLRQLAVPPAGASARQAAP